MLSYYVVFEKTTKISYKGWVSTEYINFVSVFYTLNGTKSFLWRCVWFSTVITIENFVFFQHYSAYHHKLSQKTKRASNWYLGNITFSIKLIIFIKYTFKTTFCSQNEIKKLNFSFNMLFSLLVRYYKICLITLHKTLLYLINLTMMFSTKGQFGRFLLYSNLFLSSFLTKVSEKDRLIGPVTHPGAWTPSQALTTPEHNNIYFYTHYNFLD